MTDRTPPTLVTDDNHLGGADTCAICNFRARVIDGAIIHFANPTRIVCGNCVAAIKTATA